MLVKSNIHFVIFIKTYFCCFSNQKDFKARRITRVKEGHISE